MSSKLESSATIKQHTVVKLKKYSDWKKVFTMQISDKRTYIQNVFLKIEKQNKNRRVTPVRWQNWWSLTSASLTQRPLATVNRPDAFVKIPEPGSEADATSHLGQQNPRKLH